MLAVAWKRQLMLHRTEMGTHYVLNNQSYESSYTSVKLHACTTLNLLKKLQKL